MTTLAVTKLFRSTNVLWTARRIVRANWAELAQLADIRRPFTPERWTASAMDRLGQVAARMAIASPGDSLHAADGLADLRIGRNIIPLRQALSHVPYEARHRLASVLAGVRDIYMGRWREGHVVTPGRELLAHIDVALNALLALPSNENRQTAIHALVGMRCNLFPDAPATPLTVEA